MMRSLWIVLMVALPSLVWAQKDSSQLGTITGFVKDSADDYALQSVTITVYKKADSSLLTYQITGEDGAFNLTDIPFFMPVYVNFSFTGYSPYTRNVTLDTANRVFNFRNVMLPKSQGMMDEVVIKAVVPITMNGDTLEINPAAFKLDSNAVVEDMLRRVPGVTMWGDGTITVNGKTVNNLYVDGKPFFGSDPTLATQNLPKNAIEKIQVYREEDYTKDNVDENPTDSLLTMNIKLRAERKFGYFGKVGAGVGTNDRYEVDGAGMAFNKKMRGGAAFSTNNINKSAGLSEMLRQSSYRNYNPNNQYVANLGADGISKVIFGGGFVQYDFSEQNSSRLNNQLRANYDFRNTNNFLQSQTDARNSASGTVFLQNSNQETNTVNNAHNAGINYNKRDQDKDFSVNANFKAGDNTRSSGSFSTKANEAGDLLSESSRTTNSRGTNNGLDFSTSFRNKDADDRNLKSFGINYNLSYDQSENESTSITDFISYEDATDNDYYNRRNNNSSHNFNTSLGMNYNALKRLLFGNFNLWNINMVLANNVSLSKSDADEGVSDYDSLTGQYLVNDSLTNTNRVTRIVDRPSLRFSKNFSRRLSDRFNRYININANVQGQLIREQNESNFDYRNLDRSFNFFTPAAAVSYHYERYNFYTIEMNLSGNSASSIPTINQLRPIVDTSENVYNINLGNPNLQPSVTNALSFNFNYRREQSSKKADYNVNLSGSVSDVNDAIVDSSFFDKANGRRTTYLINMDGRRVYNANFRLGTSFKMKNNKVLQFNYSVGYANTTSPNYVDGVFTISRANNVNNRLNVFYTLGDIGTVQLSQNIQSSSSAQSGANLKSFKAINYVTQGNLNINPIRNLTISNTLNYVTNNTTGQTSTLWNAFATYRFLQSKQAEVKLSAMDILKQNKNISTNASINNLSTTVTNGLEQFFMVTFSYYPRMFGGRSSRSSRSSESREDRKERRAETEKRVDRRSSREGGSERGRTEVGRRSR
ncbi:outer membrane beta-barrel protein [Niabella insulamsoli]|uniref:outer membrane beta-barrel protein n=1 Tax=Niabella insulamsoli TaxID=3144874 RepID=UPI0031FBB5C5